LENWFFDHFDGFPAKAGAEDVCQQESRSLFLRI